MQIKCAVVMSRRESYDDQQRSTRISKSPFAKIAMDSKDLLNVTCLAYWPVR